MAQTLEALLQECTVKLTLANGDVGTGFFVAPGYVLTCEHVVRNAGDEPISLRWQQDPEFAQAQIEEKLPVYDLALLRFTPPREDHPCVMFDTDIAPRDDLVLFGYPERDYPDGRPAGFICEGEFQEADLSLILLKQGQMQPGMSGAALLNGRTGKVCAMAKLTRDQYTDLGGGGIKASVILEQLPALIEWQQTFHQRDGRWQNLLSQVTPLPTCPNNLPRSGVVAFVGRESELADLHRQLHQADRLAITAIQGMGGIGKTELALQYAQHHRDQHTYPGGICWLRAKDQNVGTEIINFATDHLQLTVPTDIDLPRQAQFCWSQWPGAGAVLVVIDDVGGPDDIAAYNAIQAYLPPQSSRFWVLLTTRLQLGASIRSLQIEVLSEAAALELLESLMGADRVNREPDSAKALCHWLGYLPLGLELVGRFLQRKPGWSLAKLLERLEAKRLDAKALCQGRPDMTAAHESIAAAFELSWQDLDDPVQELAYRLSLFALAPIAWEWIEDWYDGTDPDDLEDWRDEGLINRSLLTRVGDNTVQLHQLIREFFRHKLEDWAEAEVLKQHYGQAMVQMAQAIPQTPTRDQILAVTPAIPHIAEAATTWQRWIEDDSLIWPFLGIARFHEGQGAYGQAEPWYQDCLTVARDRLDEIHPAVASSLNNLALLYWSQGRYEVAEPLYQEALTMSKALLGESHPAVAASLNNLAGLYRSQGCYEAAEPLLQEALTMSKALLGDAHPTVAISLNNLAELYRSQGRYEAAEPLLQEALTMSKALLGDAHPTVATSLNNLALLYKLQGRYEAAEPLYQEALTMRKALLGDAHPDVAVSLNNLAYLYQSQGRYEAAEPLYQAALVLRKALLGESHPAVAASLSNLAALYQSQGRYSEAEPLAIQALQTSVNALGEDHPTVGTHLGDLASLRLAQGIFADVEAMFLQALSIFVNSVGTEHPYTTEALNRLANFVATVQAAGQTDILSAHPTTQYLLQQLQREQD